MFSQTDHTALPEFGVGHAQDAESATGVTVFVAPEGAVCGVDVRGGGPATRETDLLKPEKMIQAVHAVTISGGSAFGLESSSGVMECLVKNGIGFEIGGLRVPIVPAACLFDLLVGKDVWPDKQMGSLACSSALNSLGTVPGSGNVGAGCGATVGKMGLPEQAMKAGFGFYGLRLGDLVVVANVAVNAIGNIKADDGSWLAGPLTEDGAILDPLAAFGLAERKQQEAASSTVTTNTTLGVILTNSKMTKAQATQVASMAHDGYARAIYPVHTSNDGDTIFCLASGKVEAEPDIVGIMSANAMEQAIRNATLSATSAYGLLSVSDVLR